MIQKVDVRSAQGGSISLVLNDDSAGTIVQNIDGLGPVKATLVSTSFAQQDGAQYQSSRRESRNITLTIGLEPDWAVDTVQSLRQRLYTAFMPKSKVNLAFLLADGLYVNIDGVVESMEPTMFTAKPSVDVSIMCFDPDFLEQESRILNGSSTSSSVATSFSYAGTVETGVIFKLNVNRTAGAFTVYLQKPDGSMEALEFVASMISGDRITISTVNGDKYARRTRSGVDSSVLYGVSPESSWFEFSPGTNTIRVYAEGDPIPYSIEYVNRYGGL